MAPRRSQDSLSNAGRISSFLRQAAVNKAASDACKQFREKRHRAELEKLKAGQALETVKDEEEDTANDTIMKVVLEFEQRIREETWSVHPLEWMNEKHVAIYTAEGKNWYLEKWLKECNQIQSDNVPDQKAGNEYNDGMTNAEGQSGDCAMTDDDEDDDEDDEGSEDSNEDDSDDDSDGEDNDSDKEDSKEIEVSKGMKQKPMTNLKIKQKMKTAKRQKPMGNGKIEQKLQKAKRQRPMQKAKIKQKMKKTKKEEHSDEEHA